MFKESKMKNNYKEKKNKRRNEEYIWDKNENN